MAILIKRYANRKLYNTDTSRYITLKGIATLLDGGEEVRVIDNETGDDITQIALSQILVDNKRAHEDPSDTLLTQILSRGGDALYSAIRKSVDDASDGLGDFQDRFRHLVGQSDGIARSGLGFARDKRADAAKTPKSGSSDAASPECESGSTISESLETLIRESVRDAIESLDLPSRRDIESLNRNFEHVTKAVERLEQAYLPQDSTTTRTILKRDPATSD